jgi:hypothetical protein
MSKPQPTGSDLVDLYSARHDLRRKLSLAAELEKCGREESDDALKLRAIDTRLDARTAYESACSTWTQEHRVAIPERFRLDGNGELPCQ